MRRENLEDTMDDIVPDRWYAILESTEVPANAPVARRRLGRDLVLWRDGQGTLHAADDRCPHRGAALSAGTVEDGCVTCPFHAFRFAGDGRCTSVPAHPDQPISRQLHLRTLAVREAHGLVWAWTGAGEPTGEPLFFGLDGFTDAGSRFDVEWPVHYTRVVENQLDWAHLHFVHHTTIGRFVPAEVDVQLEVTGDRIDSWIEGQSGRISVLCPNLWMLEMSAHTRAVLAFAPIDDGRTRIYSRTYQDRVRVPGADAVLGLLNRLANRVVLRQDERVVCTQRPLHGGLHQGEVYVRSDRPIAAFHRWRDTLRHRDAAAAK
ncbi:MAG: aromatic ring-hydroxylating dioxygenase subunit alpha [Alphaproteobacteria bacterium]|nr:aromatic ring-hydroxylating dioxygenase subunit alpha [Alphaproteobacteria bacterium]